MDVDVHWIVSVDERQSFGPAVRHSTSRPINQSDRRVQWDWWVHWVHQVSLIIEQGELRMREQQQMMKDRLSLIHWWHLKRQQRQHYCCSLLERWVMFHCWATHCHQHRHQCHQFHLTFVPLLYLPFAVRRCGIREKGSKFLLVRRIFWLGIKTNDKI